MWLYLDSKSSQDVLELLIKASRHYQQTILMITHNDNLAASADRIFRVSDGVLTELGRKSKSSGNTSGKDGVRL